MSGSLKPLRPHSVETRTDRRTLMKVGAWSVPVIAVAAATPAAAASTTPPVIITSDYIILDSFTAKAVFCGGKKYVNTQITVRTKDDVVIPHSSIKFKFPEQDTYTDGDEFTGTIVQHSEETLPADNVRTSRIVALFSWVNIFGFAAAADDSGSGTLTWETTIEDAEPESYEISNLDYEWFFADGAWRLSGSLDLGQPACGPGYTSDSIDVEVIGPFASWTEQTGSGNDSLHLKFLYPFGLSDPGDGMNLTFTIGEWSSGQLPFYYPAP